jgi:hypothetical protein
MSTTIKNSAAENTTMAIGANMKTAEENLLEAYSLTEGSSLTELTKKMGLSGKPVTIRSLQLIAEQRFQTASQTLNIFSGIMDKIDQLKQRLINKFSN